MDLWKREREGEWDGNIAHVNCLLKIFTNISFHFRLSYSLTAFTDPIFSLSCSYHEMINWIFMLKFLLYRQYTHTRILEELTFYDTSKSPPFSLNCVFIWDVSSDKCCIIKHFQINSIHEFRVLIRWILVVEAEKGVRFFVNFQLLVLSKHF